MQLSSTLIEELIPNGFLLQLFILRLKQMPVNKKKIIVLFGIKLFFYFVEASLFPQRRRWSNASICGYLHLLWLKKNGLICLEFTLTKKKKSDGTIWRSQHSTSFKLISTMLIIFQILIYFALALSPALFASAFMISIANLVEEGYFKDPFYGAFHLLCLSIYWTVYTVFVVRHARNQKPDVATWLVYVYVITNSLVMVATTWALVVKGIELDWGNVNGARFWLFLLVIVHAAAPIVLNAVALDGMAIVLLVRSILHFYIFLPSMVAGISAYSYSRTFDLTWGKSSSIYFRNRILKKNLKKPGTRPSASLLEKKKDETYARGQSIAAIIYFLNTLLMILIIIESGVTSFLIALAILIFGCTLLQMVFSFFYFITTRVYDECTTYKIKPIDIWEVGFRGVINLIETWLFLLEKSNLHFIFFSTHSTTLAFVWKIWWRINKKDKR